MRAYDGATAPAKPAIVKPVAMDQICHVRRGDVAGGDYLISVLTNSFIYEMGFGKGGQKKRNIGH